MCATEFQRDGVFKTFRRGTWRTSWTMHPSIVDSLEFELTWNGLNSTIVVSPQARIGQSRPMAFDGQTIRLSRDKLHWGGERHWFVCMCGKRVGKLYLPYGAPEFRCRICYNLTYRSSQQHDKKWDGTIFRRARPVRRSPSWTIIAPAPSTIVGKTAVKVDYALHYENALNIQTF
jgi:hypothetical protein